ncbi:MAG: DUF6062 family protein [Solirubrobacteraceae bacterium]
MPHSALTRWLKQGVARGMCPLCRVRHKADREYMWHFFDERSSDEGALDEVAAARGFCAEHAEQLRHIEVDGLGSTLAISDVYEHTLRALAADLDTLAPSTELGAARCPACTLLRRSERPAASTAAPDVWTSPPARSAALQISCASSVRRPGSSAMTASTSRA